MVHDPGPKDFPRNLLGLTAEYAGSGEIGYEAAPARLRYPPGVDGGAARGEMGERGAEAHEGFRDGGLGDFVAEVEAR